MGQQQGAQPGLPEGRVCAVCAEAAHELCGRPGGCTGILQLVMLTDTEQVWSCSPVCLGFMPSMLSLLGVA